MPTFGSLFSGIGGLDLGLERAGWECRWQVEIDEWRRGILERNWPRVERYPNVAAFPPDGRAGPDVAGAAQRGSRGNGWAVDLICGGFPCQDVSVAGRRAGLAGARSGLFHEFARIADALRPGLLLLENVPGLLTSNGGRDFGVVLGTLADIGYGVAWRVLDSRFFGVPQRRRRVFIVGALPGGDSGARRASEVLAVGTGCERHPAKGGAARTEVASTVGGGAPGGGISDDIDRRPMIPVALEGGAPDRGWRVGADEAGAGHIVTEDVSATLKADGSHWKGADYESYVVPSLTTGGNQQDDQQSRQFVAPALTKNYGKQPDNSDTNAGPMLVAHSLTSEGHASEGGTGRGTPMVAYDPHRTLQPDGSVVEGFKPDDVVDALHQPTGNKEPLVSPSLHGFEHGTNGQLDKRVREQMAQLGAGVRRLTPVECCRLQGFPDDWLGEPNEPPDSPRYAAMGDAVTVNVAEWIGRRLMEHA